MGAKIINNKRIAKNTLLLYLRTLFVMGLSLYTSRVILDVLGVSDYGVYQTIGGMVVMFSVISGSMSAAISRFITYEIGKGDKTHLSNIFNTSIVIQIILSLVIVLVAEIVGVWFMTTKMQIPPDRVGVAFWVLQWSLLSFCINLLSLPYNATLVAYEKMNVFAYMGVVEAVCKLGICFLLPLLPTDKLATYSFLLVVLSLFIRLFYGLYCKRHFEECNTKLTFDLSTFKQMFGFAGWNFMTSAVSIFNNQGVNMLMNVYFGVTVNAARGVANQVENAVLQFVNNFTTAVNPQITKSYANEEFDGMYTLVCRSAKFSFFAMFIMALPIICEANTILNIWLVEVPEYTVAFVQLSLILGMLDCIGRSGYTACMATGKLKRYTIVITSIGIWEFPLTWIFFKFGAPVITSYYLFIIVKSMVLVARMYLLQDMIGLKVSRYIKEVFLPIIFTTIVSIIPLVFIIQYVTPSIYRLLLTILVGSLSVSIVVLFIGCSKNERALIINKVKNIANKITHKK